MFMRVKNNTNSFHVATLEAAGAESCLEKRCLPLQKYAYLWAKGCYSISISCAVACMKIEPNILQISVVFLCTLVNMISKEKRLTALGNFRLYFCIRGQQFWSRYKRSKITTEQDIVANDERWSNPNYPDRPEIFIKGHFDIFFFFFLFSLLAFLFSS